MGLGIAHSGSEREKLLNGKLLGLGLGLLFDAALKHTVFLNFLVEHNRDFIYLQRYAPKIEPYLLLEFVVLLADGVDVILEEAELGLFLEPALFGRLAVLHKSKQRLGDCKVGRPQELSLLTFFVIKKLTFARAVNSCPCRPHHQFRCPEAA